MSMSFSDFKIHFEGSKEKISQALEIAEEVLEYEGLSEELDEEQSVRVEKDSVLIYVDDIESELARPIAEQVQGLNFIISGVVDTSESAGEYMNFIIQNQDGNLTVQSSCWYVILHANDFESYEDFCNEYTDDDGEPLYSEVQFEQFKTGEWFVLDSGDGEIVGKVPLLMSKNGKDNCEEGDSVADFTIRFVGSDEDIRQAVAIVERALHYDKIEPKKTVNVQIEVDETQTLFYEDEITDDLAALLLESLSALQFDIECHISSEGEYSDFTITSEDGKLVRKSTGWYIRLDMEQFEDYDEFCDEYEREDGRTYTKKEYQKFKKGNWFVLDSGDGEIVNEVPFSDMLESE